MNRVFRTRRLPCVCVLAAAWVLLTGARASAQSNPRAADEPARRLTLLAGGGCNAQWDDESRLGQGVTVSGGVAYRLLRHVSIEGLVHRMPHRRDLVFYQVTDPANGPATAYPSTLKGSATYVLAQVRYVFSTSRVQPYAAGALGVMHYSGNGWEAVFPPASGIAAPVGGETATTAAKGISGGVDVEVAPRVTVGPYFGLLSSNNDRSGTKNVLHGGVRVAVGW